MGCGQIGRSWESEALVHVINVICAMSMASIILFQGIEITPFVDPWSTITMRLSNPSLLDRSVIKSQVTCEKSFVSFCPLIGIKPAEDGCVLIFIC